MNECVRVEGFDPASAKLTLNRWIRGETLKTAEAVTAAIEACAFDDAADALYRFIWNIFCDWHLELSKPILGGDDEAAKAETRAMTAWVLDVALKLLHPVMPFITEELWQQTAEFGPPRDGFLMTASWPDLPSSYADVEAAGEIDWLIDLITAVRAIRAEMNVPASARPPLTLVGAGEAAKARVARDRTLIKTLGRLDDVRLGDSPPVGAVPFVIGEATGALSIAEFVNVEAERSRLGKEIAGLSADIERTSKKLSNPDFVSRAPEEVVEENRERLADAEAAKAKLAAALERLEAVS
jgi:valyl-tRNA synthetase